MFRIGLTGGIGSGKSEVARVLRRLGTRVVEADRLARDLVAPGRPVLGRIIEEFGPAMLRPDGTLDRTKLGAIVFGDRERLSVLNAIIHPPLVEAIVEVVEALERAEPEGVVVVDAALLVQWDVLDAFDTIVLVTAPEEIRIERLVSEGLSPADARARIASQLPEARLLEVADVVIENGSSLDELERRVERFWSTLPGNPGEVAR